jgi:hypothetical protein
MIGLGNIFGGSLVKGIKDLVGTFKLDPAKKAELEAVLDRNAAAIEVKQRELEITLAGAITAEIEMSGRVIEAEARSKSWLPRNVRPLLLLMWGTLITLNALLPLVSRVVGVAIEPIPLDPWVYKLTAIGFTGYVTGRTIEKIRGAD